jgi:hypothetical protein
MLSSIFFERQRSIQHNFMTRWVTSCW